MNYRATTSSGTSEDHPTLLDAIQALAVLMTGDASPLGTVTLYDDLGGSGTLRNARLVATIGIDPTSPLAPDFSLYAMNAENMTAAE